MTNCNPALLLLEQEQRPACLGRTVGIVEGTGWNPPVPDPVCAAAADRIEVLEHEEVLEPDNQYADALDYELLTGILQSVERSERKTRNFLQPKYKARIVSALYGVALAKGPDHDLGIEYLIRVVQGRYKEYLEVER